MKKVGLVLAGGGGKGAYQIGVWKALRETGLDKYISVVSGASVGGLNAALFTQGDFEKAQNIWENISPEKIMKHNGAGLIDIIDNHLDMRVFDNKNCYVSCTSLSIKNTTTALFDEQKEVLKYARGRATYFNLRNYSDQEKKSLLLATSAIPTIFKFQKIRGTYYIDGGFSDNLPIDPLYKFEKCDVIIAVQLNNGSGSVDKHQYPHAVILEITSNNDLGGPFSGILNFNAQDAQHKMSMGYTDLIELFKKVKELIEQENNVVDQLKEIYNDELEYLLRNYIYNKNLAKRLQKESIPKYEGILINEWKEITSELDKRVNELVANWQSEDLISLMAECENVLSLNEKQIKQLDVKGFKAFWHFFTGVNKKGNQKLYCNMHDLHKLALSIQKIILHRVDNITQLIININKKINANMTQSHEIELTLLEKLEKINTGLTALENRVNIMDWQLNIEALMTSDKLRYRELSNSRKILQITSDIFEMNNGNIEEFRLNKVLMELQVSNKIKCQQFYEEIISEKNKTLPLFIKSGLDYNNEAISEYGRIINAIREICENKYINDIAKNAGQTVNDVCKQYIINYISISYVDTALLCFALLNDLKLLYKNKINTDKTLEETFEEINTITSEASNSSNLISTSNTFNTDSTYSLMKITPKKIILLKDGIEECRKLNNHEYNFSDEAAIKHIISTTNAQLIALSAGFYANISSLTSNISESSTIVPLSNIIQFSDYYMYLWFNQADKEQVKRKVVIMIDYYHPYLYISGYRVNNTGESYNKLINNLRISCKSSHSHIVKDILSKTIFSNYRWEDITSYQTFSDNDKVDSKLKKINVIQISDEWEKQFLENTSDLTHIIDNIKSIS